MHFMKVGLTILIAINSVTLVFGTAVAMTNPTDSTVKVLVLPPFDAIENAGVSPDISKIIETTLTEQGQLSVLSFPYKQLMGVPYQMVFDKKYCRPILDKVDCDVIIMSQIITDNERKPGFWPWSYKIRVYNARTGKQLNSIQGDNLKAEDFQKDINSKVDKLIRDIEQTFKIG
jgi:hypothetical protein